MRSIQALCTIQQSSSLIQVSLIPSPVFGNETNVTSGNVLGKTRKNHIPRVGDFNEVVWPQ